MTTLQSQLSAAKTKSAELEQQLTTAHTAHSALRSECHTVTTQLNAEKALSDARNKQCVELKAKEEGMSVVVVVVLQM